MLEEAQPHLAVLRPVPPLLLTPSSPQSRRTWKRDGREEESLSPEGTRTVRGEVTRPASVVQERTQNRPRLDRLTETRKGRVKRGLPFCGSPALGGF